MFDGNKNRPPKLIIVLCITLASWLILLPIVNQIMVPMGTNSTGVISFASIVNINPITDYLKYLVLFLTPALIGLIFVNLQAPLIDKILSTSFKIVNNKIIWGILTATFIFAWLTNKYIFGPGFFNIISLLSDTFHEGEYLAFLPSFLQLNKPFLSTFFIHGFGLNALPSILASKIATGNGIILTRCFISFLNIAAFFGVFWTIWELLSYFDLAKQKIYIFLLLCLTVCAGDNSMFFSFAATRETWLIFQLPLLLRYLRIKDSPSWQSKILPLIIGASIPLSFFYVYDRAAYFLSIYLVCSVLLLLSDQKLAKTWLISTGSGIVASLVILAGILGIDQLGAIGSQVLYWMKYGRYISFIPLPPLNFSLDNFAFWWPMFLHGSLALYLVLDFWQNPKLTNFIKEKLVVILLLFSSLNYMRITLDRSDVPHALSGASMSFILLIYLGLIAYTKYWKNRTTTTLNQPIYSLFYSMISLSIITSNHFFDVGLATKSLQKAVISVPDLMMIQPEYKEAIMTMQPEIDNQSCFFSIPSEGVWYYLLNKPSCSKFSYTFYAQPTVAQNEVVKDLETTKPEIILFSNDKLYDTDQVATIYRYSLAKYRPYTQVKQHWFWRRRTQNLQFLNDNSTQGFYNLAPLQLDQNGRQKIRLGDNLGISGWAIFPKQNRPVDAIYLSYGEDNQLIAVTQVNQPSPGAVPSSNNPAFNQSGWNLSIPTKALQLGDSILKLWSYDAKSDQFSQLGQAIKIKVIEAHSQL